jgi:UDP-N-acetylmuramoylalanine--D-glutamate ligase
MLANLSNKKIGIFGLGLTGKSIYQNVSLQSDNIICWDDSEMNRSSFQKKNILHDLESKFWQTLDIIFISPGVPNNHKIYLLAKEHKILISSDIELFIQCNPDSKIIIITGTNGKSTTTALIGHILNNSHFDFPVGGNIGLPALLLPKHKVGYVLEISSFQLDLISHLDPAIAVLLNITPDHLDRHGTFNDYCKAKERALNGDGVKIIGVNNETSRNLYNKLRSNGDKRVIAISSTKSKNAIACTESALEDDFYDAQVYKIPSLPNLPGYHNRENIAASYAVCRSLGMSPEDIIKQLSTFPGLKHRMQNVGSNRKVTYFNDSKATNASSAASSLSAITNIFWLAGGIFKEENLIPLEKSLKNVKKAYLFGQSKLLFSKYLQDKVEFKIFETMHEAFAEANRDAKKEQKSSNILLAPACSSFDQFKNFEDRGNQFIELCNEELSK